MQFTGTRLILSKDEYAQYLTSPHWLLIQDLVYSAVTHCQLCWFGHPLNIHHITYERLGNENFEDLIVLCQRCHIERAHGKRISPSELNTLVTGQLMTSGVLFWSQANVVARNETRQTVSLISEVL